MTGRTPLSTRGVVQRSLVAAVVLAAVGAAPSAARDWNVDVIDGVPYFTWSELEYGPDGVGYLFYGRAALYLATLSPVGTTVTTLDRVCYVTDIEADVSPGGIVGVAYSADRTVTRLAEWNGATWRFEDVPGVAYSSPAVGFAYDRLGVPYIASYDDRTGTIWLSYRAGASWVSEKVATGIDVRYELDLRIDAAGTPHVIFGDSLRLLHATLDAGSWRVKTVAGIGGSAAALAIDGSNQPVVAYLDPSAGNVWFATWDGLAWNSVVVEPSDGDVQLELAPDGRMTILHIDFPFVRRGSFNGIAWTFETADSTGWYGSSLGYDLAGNPGVGFVDRDNDLTYVHYDGSRWNSVLVEAKPVTVNSIGGFTAMAMDGSGQPALSYLNSDRDGMDFARWTGSAWSIEAVTDWVTSPFATNEVAVDSTAAPAIAHVDRSGNLLLLRPDVPLWSSTVVAPAEQIGIGLAFDSADQAVVAYWSGAALRIATEVGVAWVFDTVETLSRPGAGIGVDLALDRANRPVLTYHDWTTGMVKMARWDGAAWQIASIGPADFFATPPSLAIGPTDRPSVAYVAAGPELRLATFDGVGFAIEGVLPESSKYVDLAIAADGTRGIAYQAADGLRLVIDDGAGWSGELVEGSEIGQTGEYPNLGFDLAGQPVVGFHNRCALDLRVARTLAAPQLLRRPVATLAPGWQAGALPLSQANDDETAPFPLTVTVPGTATDALPPAAPLTLYRLLRADGSDVGGPLLLAATPTGIGFAF